MQLAEMKTLYLKAVKAYYNTGKPVMTDAEFDKLERSIAKLDPEWDQLKKTGTAVGKKTEVPLTYFMPSSAKMYPATTDKWVAKQKNKSWVWSHKLDGNSVQGEWVNGKCVRLVTRGDGTNGGDISFLIPYLNLPKIKADTGHYIFRFEAIMPIATFNKKWSREAKGDKGFDNARNLVSGALNRTTAHKCLKDIDFVVLGVYDRGYSEGLEWADDQGFKVVKNSGIKKLSAESLTDRLRAERKTAVYEMDGLVLTPFDQLFQYDNADRPKWSIAFKINETSDMAETVVEDVIWQMSRTGRWTPKIKIKPVQLKGVTVTYATAHNAQWMIDRGIAKGAKVGIVRSGDVIPKIETVLKPSKHASYPPGEFTMKGVHYVAVGDHKDADVRAITHFYQVLGIDHIARKTVDKLYDAGLKTVRHHMLDYAGNRAAYLHAGIGSGMTNKIMKEVKRVLDDEGVSLIKIMNASNCFESFGERRLQMIHDHFVAMGNPDILRQWVKERLDGRALRHIREQVCEIPKFKDATTEQFVRGLIEFQLWFKAVLKAHAIKINKPEVKKAKKKTGGKFAGEYVSWTGYRSEDQEEEVEAQGGDVIKLGAKTTILFYNPNGKFMAKVEAARAKGIKTLVWGDK